MASSYSIGEGIVGISREGFLHYRGSIRGDIEEDEMVSLVKSIDLSSLEIKLRDAHKIIEPISKHEARFPAKMPLCPGNDSEQGFLFDGYKYYLVNNVWVRYHQVERNNGILKKTSKYSIADGIIIRSEDGFREFVGEIKGDVKKDERISLIKSRDLDSLERPVVGDTPQIMGPISKHEAMFPSVWIINNGDEKQKFHFTGYKYCTSDSLWLGYHPVKN